MVCLGRIVGGNKLRIDQFKVQFSMSYSTLINLVDVRSLWGASQYLRKFIEHLSFASTPLHNLSKGVVKL